MGRHGHLVTMALHPNSVATNDWDKGFLAWIFKVKNLKKNNKIPLSDERIFHYLVDM
jgi:hypothetical protein